MSNRKVNRRIKRLTGSSLDEIIEETAMHVLKSAIEKSNNTRESYIKSLHRELKENSTSTRLLSKVEISVGISSADELKSKAIVTKDGKLMVEGCEIQLEDISTINISDIDRPINPMNYLIAFNCMMYKIIEVVEECVIKRYGEKALKSCTFNLAGVKNTLINIYGCKADKLDYLVYEDLLSLIGKEAYKELGIFSTNLVTGYDNILPYYLALSKYPKHFYAVMYSSIAYLEESDALDIDSELSVREALSRLQGFPMAENRLLLSISEIQNVWYASVKETVKQRLDGSDTMIVMDQDTLFNVSDTLKSYLLGQSEFNDVIKAYSEYRDSAETNMARILANIKNCDESEKVERVLSKIFEQTYGGLFRLSVETALVGMLKKSHASIAKYTSQNKKELDKLNTQLTNVNDLYHKTEKELRQLKKDSSHEKSGVSTQELESLTGEVEGLREENQSLTALLNMEKEEVKSIQQRLYSSEEFSKNQKIEIDGLKKVLEAYGISDNDVESILQMSVTEEDTEEQEMSIEEMLKEINDYKIVICGGNTDNVSRLKERGLSVDGHIEEITRKDSKYEIYVFICERISHTLMWQAEKLADSQGALKCYVKSVSADNIIRQIYRSLA